MTVFPLIFKGGLLIWKKGQLSSILIYNFSRWFTIVLMFLASIILR